MPSGRVGGAAIDTFAKEPTTESPLFALDNVVVTPHLGASTAEAQDKAGETIAEQVVLAFRGDFVPFAVNVAASEASEYVRPYLPLAERVGRLFTGLAGGAVNTLNIEYEGEIADYDCRVLTLSILKGVLAPVVDEPVSFVNAPQIAEQRGIVGPRDEVVGRARLRESHRRARRPRHARRGDALRQAARPRIVGIDGHSVDLPPARHMLVVHNDDSPGMIGRVGTVLGDAKINISNMDVGQSPSGEAALMVIATETSVPADVVERVTQQAGRAVRPRDRPGLRPVSAFGAAQAVALRRLASLGVTAVGVGAVVVRAAGHVVDAARELRLHRMRRRAAAVGVRARASRERAPRPGVRPGPPAGSTSAGRATCRRRGPAGTGTAPTPIDVARAGRHADCHARHTAYATPARTPDAERPFHRFPHRAQFSHAVRRDLPTEK